MRLRNISAAALAALMMCVPCFAGDITVNINGKAVDFPNQKPVIQDGRTLIPLRGVFDTLGYDIAWAGDTKTVTLAKDSDLITIVIGQKSYYQNGVSHETDVPAQIINGSTMLPLRAIAEAAGLSVVWDAEKKTAILLSPDHTDDNSESYYVSYDEQDKAFLLEYKEVSEEFDEAVNTFNECMQWAQSEGLHNRDDIDKVCDALATLKSASETAISRLAPLACSEKAGKLKNTYIAFARSCGDNADVFYKYMKGDMSEEEYLQAYNDTTASMVAAETEYKTALSEMASGS